MSNKTYTTGGAISVGTVIHGTGRAVDLLRALGAELLRVAPGEPLAAEALQNAEIIDRADAKDTDHEIACAVLCDVIDRLNLIAALEGLWFGAHEGDGSDFGYWSDHEQTEDAQ